MAISKLRQTSRGTWERVPSQREILSANRKQIIVDGKKVYDSARTKVINPDGSERWVMSDAYRDALNKPIHNAPDRTFSSGVIYEAPKPQPILETNPLNVVASNPIPTNTSLIGSKSKMSAWDTLRSNYFSLSPFQQWYQKVDYGLFGILPGGLSMSQVKSLDLELKAKDIVQQTQAEQTIADARRQQQEQAAQNKVVEDMSNKSFLEWIGIGYSQAEKQYQTKLQQMREQTALNDLNYFSQFSAENQPTNPIYTIGSELGSGFTSGATSSTQTNWGNYALIAVAAILGIMVLKK